jgi:cobyrinic acid a,c-diamide synthase
MMGWPVLLVLDPAGQAQTAAAVARGLREHDPAVRVAGVILNRVASERHRALIADAIAALDIPLLGALPRETALALPERHLGLVQAGEHRDLAALIDRLADTAERHLDLDGLLNCASLFTAASAIDRPAVLPPPGQRIALARDHAFSFVYPHVIDAWRKAGAEILPFSPLADEAPPAGADSCWLSGGYPELHAETLANARNFVGGVKRFAETRPVHGECGGYMVLGETLEDAAGHRHPMTGLLGHWTSFAKRKLNLGYRTARLLSASVLGNAGTVIRGHEFHYATLMSAGGDDPFAEVTDAEGRRLDQAGGQRGQVTGTFFHAIAARRDQEDHRREWGIDREPFRSFPRKRESRLAPDWVPAFAGTNGK